MADLGRAIPTEPARPGTPQKPRSPSSLGHIARSGRIFDIMARKILGPTALNCEGCDFYHLLLACSGSLVDGHDVSRSPVADRRWPKSRPRTCNDGSLSFGPPPHLHFNAVRPTRFRTHDLILVAASDLILGLHGRHRDSRAHRRSVAHLAFWGKIQRIQEEGAGLHSIHELTRKRLCGVGK